MIVQKNTHRKTFWARDKMTYLWPTTIFGWDFNILLRSSKPRYFTGKQKETSFVTTPLQNKRNHANMQFYKHVIYIYIYIYTTQMYTDINVCIYTTGITHDYIYIHIYIFIYIYLSTYIFEHVYYIKTINNINNNNTTFFLGNEKTFFLLLKILCCQLTSK